MNEYERHWGARQRSERCHKLSYLMLVERIECHRFRGGKIEASVGNNARARDEKDAAVTNAGERALEQLPRHRVAPVHVVDEHGDWSFIRERLEQCGDCMHTTTERFLSFSTSLRRSEAR